MSVKIVILLQLVILVAHIQSSEVSDFEPGKIYRFFLDLINVLAPGKLLLGLPGYIEKLNR